MSAPAVLVTFLIRTLIILVILILLDIYAYQGIKVIAGSAGRFKNGIKVGYWIIHILYYLFILYSVLLPGQVTGPNNRLFTTIFGLFVLLYIPKIIFIVFLFGEDIYRLIRYSVSKLFNSPNVSDSGQKISRSVFLSKTALVLAGIPFAAVAYGILKGKYNYQLTKVKLRIPGLPNNLSGIRIAQISDIHSGSFDDSEAVANGVEMLIQEKPDLVFFTGDLVNTRSEEIEPYIPVFKRIQAKYGVFSILGNHDYGDYEFNWKPGEKALNMEKLKKAHADMGWDLLLNEHRKIEIGTSKIAIIGVENWGAKANFPKYGKLDIAVSGTDYADVKLLLSHDPSHWEAQVLTGYPDIDVTFSGHTHGFQFGIEALGIKWSPVQYVYKQWAGLYSREKQQLYVNRGFGFIGFPGRVGIMPEITLFELQPA